MALLIRGIYHLVQHEPSSPSTKQPPLWSSVNKSTRYLPLVTTLCTIIRTIGRTLLEHNRRKTLGNKIGHLRLSWVGDLGRYMRVQSGHSRTATFEPKMKRQSAADQGS